MVASYINITYSAGSVWMASVMVMNVGWKTAHYPGGIKEVHKCGRVVEGKLKTGILAVWSAQRTTHKGANKKEKPNVYKYSMSNIRLFIGVFGYNVSHINTCAARPTDHRRVCVCAHTFCELNAPDKKLKSFRAQIAYYDISPV